MITHTALSYLKDLEKRSNKTYYEHKRDIINLIFDCKSPDEIFERLKCSDAWIMLTREPFLMEEVRKWNEPIYNEIDSLSEMHLSSL